jgi:dienelactone hydrolase
VIFPFLLLLAAELPRGSLIPRVPATQDPKLSYALYLPSFYSPERRWPILYCLDPGARGHLPVERFSKAAEAEGFIVAGSNDSRNGPIELVEQAISAMLDDTASRFSIDPKRVYAAGFSGGSRVALGWAMNGRIAGVVACGAAFGAPRQPSRIPFSLFACAGVDDFNYGELYALSVAVAKSQSPQRFAEFQGGHEWLPEGLALEALQFFNGKLPSKPVAPSRQALQIDSRMRRATADIQAAARKARTRLIARFRNRSEAPQDSPDRRVARRALNGAFIGALEQARSAMDHSDFARAIELLELALEIRPDAAVPRAMLEKARANR